MTSDRGDDPRQESAELGPAEPFDAAERAAVYRAIYTRRDVRNEFLDTQVPQDLVLRILDAAHHAPSVGFMQPWNFILIRDSAVRGAVHKAFMRGAEAEARLIEPERRTLYQNLKLEGILKAPLNICVTCDRARNGATGLGRTQQPNMDLLSVACAVQNLWLAARVEGVGVGWVSIMQDSELRDILNIPEEIAVVAYLCVGFVERAYRRPELEVKRWRPASHWKRLSSRIGGASGKRPRPPLHKHALKFVDYFFGKSLPIVNGTLSLVDEAD